MNYANVQDALYFRFWHEADILLVLEVCSERTAEVRICLNNRDPGLILASDNQSGAGHGFSVNILRQRELQNADEDDFGKVLHNLMIQQLLHFPFSQVQLSMLKPVEVPQKSPQRLMHR